MLIVVILVSCSGIRWTAVLESVQRNPLTNVFTLQSIPPFGRFPFNEFRQMGEDDQLSTTATNIPTIEQDADLLRQSEGTTDSKSKYCIVEPTDAFRLLRLQILAR